LSPNRPIASLSHALSQSSSNESVAFRQSFKEVALDAHFLDKHRLRRAEENLVVSADGIAQIAQE
jgi:hypothetical protein